MGANTSKGSPETNHFERLERLPLPLRQVLCRAPFNFKVGMAEKYLKHCGSVTEARSLMIEHIVTYSMHECRGTYTADHPQASREGWRR